jgi:hypothetical protein
MSKFLRLAALLCCLGVLVLGTIAVGRNGPLLSSFRGRSARKISWAELIEDSERIDRLEEASFRRINTKMHIAEEVIARRQSLAEAMKQFHALDQEWPQFDLRSARRFQGISEDEWDGQRVLICVQFVLESRHDEGSAVLGHLEKELQELLADRKKRPAAPAQPRLEERSR